MIFEFVTEPAQLELLDLSHLELEPGLTALIPYRGSKEGFCVICLMDPSHHPSVESFWKSLGVSYHILNLLCTLCWLFGTLCPFSLKIVVHIYMFYFCGLVDE